MSQDAPRRSRRNNELLDSAEELAAGVGRLGYGLLSLGLGLLPPQSRRHMHNAVRELSYAFAELPRSFATIAGEEIERWAVDGEAAPPAEASAVHRMRVSTGDDALDTAPSPAAVVGVGITHIEYDPPGRDLDGEYVVVSNTTGAPVDLTGWTLRDGGARHVFVFPPFTLAPDGAVRIWTKAGTNDAANLYWGSRGAIWNNEGDTGTLLDAAGNLVSSYSYEGRS